MANRRAFGLLLATAIAGWGCGTDSSRLAPDTTPDAGQDAGTDGAELSTDSPGDLACAAGQTPCGTTCVDLATDPEHCGACGMRCAFANAGALCTTGRCVLAGCNAGFGDCDANPANGCEADLGSSTSHCGACSLPCHPAHATGACMSGTCTTGSCSAGFGDCNLNAADGCETDLNTTLTSCGTCGSTCGLENATATCTEGRCAVASCQAGFGDCDTNPANGCETPLNGNAHCGACGAACPGAMRCAGGACVSACPASTPSCPGSTACVNTDSDLTHCGGCGNACAAGPNASASCSMGMCGRTCADGFGDCDGDPSNGCETALSSTASACGACDHRCALPNAAAACSAGRCAVAACAAGFGDCNGSAADGCETDLASTPAACGACGTSCSLPNARPACVLGRCAIAACNAGFGDCDSNPANGCETPLTSNAHCGACGVACTAGTRCAGAACVSTCPAGTTLCAAAGVCANLATDVAHCGLCGTACPALANAAPACSAGRCGVTCNAGFGDCDANPANGCEASLQGSAAHCGACGARCALAHATAACVAGRCAIAACDAGSGDCNGSAADGCETSLLGSASACGSCGNACALPNATAACVAGRCAVGACHAGFGDCNGDAADGCEAPLTSNRHCGRCGGACVAGTRCADGACVSSCPPGTAYCPATGTCANTASDPAHCGGCGRLCPVPPQSAATCASGACGFACNPGFADCDGNAGNGCETNLNASAAHCGRCGGACNLPNAAPACAGGACGIASCAAGFGDCDGVAATGCETNLQTTAAACGACSTACDLPNATAGCAGGRCAVAACGAGFGDCDRSAVTGCETPLDTNSDCGRCGNRCAPGTRCAGGSCVSTCPSGTTFCAATGTCVDTSSDPNHCGLCGTVCPRLPNSARSCVRGTCAFVCDPAFGDCDRREANGCETSLGDDGAHCGACGARCAPANASGVCSRGGCVIATCNAGFADCNGLASDGCEAHLETDPTACGSCGNACAAPNATPGCAAGRCTIARCNAGFGNCNGLTADGCETRLDSNFNCGACRVVCAPGTFCSSGACVSVCPPGTTFCPLSGTCRNLASDPSHCGACERGCPTPANARATCTGGTCDFVCRAGFGNCDGDPRNGCETSLDSNVAHCGACGRTCTIANGTPACAAGTCSVGSCNAGFGNCNGDPADGCETHLRSSPAHCGSCRAACDLPNANEGCVGGMCTVASCHAGFGNCNGATADGCETRLDSNLNCGRCGNACRTGTRCAGSACVSSCPPGTTFCPASNTCANLASDPTHCGACGARCPTAPNATPTCAMATCGFQCNAGYGDCDGLASDGCETHTDSNVNHCGACGARCAPPNAQGRCSGGACGIAACNTGFRDCNRVVRDGCETNVFTSNANCGACGNACPAGTSCVRGACT